MSKLDYCWIVAARERHDNDEEFARAIEKQVRTIAINDAAVAADMARSKFAASGHIREAAGAWCAHQEIRNLAKIEGDQQ